VHQPLEALHVVAAAPTQQDRFDPYSGLFYAHFQGQGRTPDERRNHMQRQLARLSTSPSSVLAPSTWPAGTATSLS
jgi:hypothetical protein